jgi:hypothetical protein
MTACRCTKLSLGCVRDTCKKQQERGEVSELASLTAAAIGWVQYLVGMSKRGMNVHTICAELTSCSPLHSATCGIRIARSLPTCSENPCSLEFAPCGSRLCVSHVDALLTTAFLAFVVMPPRSCTPQCVTPAPCCQHPPLLVPHTQHPSSFASPAAAGLPVAAAFVCPTTTHCSQPPSWPLSGCHPAAFPPGP